MLLTDSRQPVLKFLVVKSCVQGLREQSTQYWGPPRSSYRQFPAGPSYVYIFIYLVVVGIESQAPSQQVSIPLLSHIPALYFVCLLRQSHVTQARHDLDTWQDGFQLLILLTQPPTPWGGPTTLSSTPVQ